MIGGRLRFETSRATEFLDITDLLRQEVRRAGMRVGRLHLQSPHPTLRPEVTETEPLLLQDFASMLERFAPVGAGYEHDDFARRVDVALDEPINGHAHVRQLLLTGFATLLVEEGDLVLGRWQSIFAVELDGPRHRELALQLDGEFVSPPRSPGRSAPPAKRAQPGGGNGAHYPDSDLIELELFRQLLVDPEPVSAPMRRLVEAGGKRLRPKLVQLTAAIGPRSEPLRAAALG